MKALMSNEKTYKCIDFTTICPKRLNGNPCSYCYVESARKIGYRAKQEIEFCNYDHDLLKLRQSTIDKLNACGGLRLFSFSDYIPWMDPYIEMLIEDSNKLNLKLKAITKVPEFIHKFAYGFDVIHISIDNVNCGVDWDIAKGLKERYDNVKIRAAIMSQEDIPILDWVDILTLNHARNGFHVFKKIELQSLLEKYPNKICCETGKCISCHIKCGKLN